MYEGSGSYRVVRGGCWYSEPKGVRASVRGRITPGSWYNFLGFRLAEPK
ncbi:MAG TPA: hypothetical protein DCP92_12790 [Nitrospiraceae bacterium]|nr:hypothetical protein [Nitrospiraceae bacterium]